MTEVVLLSAVRTPIGKLLGGLSHLSATRLGAIVVGEAVSRAGVRPPDVDEVIMGNVVSAGLGQNPARQAALGAGLPDKVAAMTINKVCGSGLKAVGLAAQAIQTGNAEVVVAGGMESMSNAPYLVDKARQGYRLGHGRLLDSVVHDGLWDAYEDFHMGCTGEVAADEYRISRERQDRFAFASHMKAVEAAASGRFADEIVRVPGTGRKGTPGEIEADESPRADTSLQALAALRPAFRDQGTVTAGNAPGISDGAAALLVSTREYADRLGRDPIARIVGQAVSGIAPRLAMMAPVEAIGLLLQKVDWSLPEVDLVELNEAFSAQALAVIDAVGLDPRRVNVNGGAVALGHPIGASGARILVTLLHAMNQRDARRGIAALCLGGGNAVALAVERG
jgi:acetyl-CoA C-acetyltransferase